MSRDSHGTGLDGMMILAMATRLPDLVPTVTFDETDHFPNLHGNSLSEDFVCTKEQQTFIGAIVWAIVGSYRQPVVHRFCR
jgi:hypothetical protein